MSVLYAVVPFDDVINKPEIVEQLRSEYGIEIPSDAKLGRHPMLNELRAALNALPDAKITYHDLPTSWYAEVETADQQRLFINAHERLPEDSPHKFTYQGDVELIIAVVSALTPICGTMLIFQGGDYAKLVL